MKRLLVLMALMVALVGLSGCNNTKVESSTQAGGGSASTTVKGGYVCHDNPDGTQTCLPTKDTQATGTGGSTSSTTKTDSSTNAIK